MQFFIELLIWHLVIAGFLIGALALSRGVRNSNGPMNFTDNAAGD